MKTVTSDICDWRGTFRVVRIIRIVIWISLHVPHPAIPKDVFVDLETDLGRQPTEETAVAEERGFFVDGCPCPLGLSEDILEFLVVVRSWCCQFRITSGHSGLGDRVYCFGL